MQETDEYQEYLSRSGEDNKQYYEVKIKATKLLLDNVDHTFVTPVFAGSASLRDAAGQLIENTVKSVRRGQDVGGGYMEKLYSDTVSLYRLDQIGGRGSQMSSEKADLGKLPVTSIILLVCLAGAWGLIALYVLFKVVKNKRNHP